MILAMHRLLFREMREHLDAEATVQVIGNSLPPRAPHDLRREAAGGARLRHDVIGQQPSAFQEILSRHDFIDHPVFQRRLGVDRFARQQSVGRPLNAQQLLEAAVNAVARHRTDVIMKVEITASSLQIVRSHIRQISE